METCSQTSTEQGTEPAVQLAALRLHTSSWMAARSRQVIAQLIISQLQQCVWHVDAHLDDPTAAMGLAASPFPAHLPIWQFVLGPLLLVC